ncbi:MAG: prepilin-type N-terminal cleavage/methylation domain-containing protein [Planctomycetaceae bacterium]|jgi:prepilin-type N-terminal cleavage/methylation domain-containing protein|nr:prepilin-type N-terminal cleavage/methylation domain-containing protein [Planctomycetaceae bacterium]
MRRGFSLVELLIALAISAALLTSVLAALQACFRAYQATTEEASTDMVGRVVMYRMLSLVRNGAGFEPLPDLEANPPERIIASNSMSFIDDDEREIEFQYLPNTNGELGELRMRLTVNGATGQWQRLLEGVRAPRTPEGDDLPVFTLEYDTGYKLVRATIDMTVYADDNASVQIEGDEVRPIRLVGGTAPRRLVW